MNRMSEKIKFTIVGDSGCGMSYSGLHKSINSFFEKKKEGVKQK